MDHVLVVDDVAVLRLLQLCVATVSSINPCRTKTAVRAFGDKLLILNFQVVSPQNGTDCGSKVVAKAC